MDQGDQRTRVVDVEYYAILRGSVGGSVGSVRLWTGA